MTLLIDVHPILGVLWEARRPHGYCACLQIKRSGFEPWPGTLCCVLGQDTLLSHSHSASLHPGVEMGTGEFNAGSNPVMD